MADYGLGRLHIPDDRDANFPMTSVLPTKTDRTYRYWWTGGWWGNQARNPWCVDYGWHHWAADGPITGKAPMWKPGAVYFAAQKIDQWPGENYDGTSVRAGAKILQQMGRISAYHWARNIDDMVMAALTKGPIVVGTLWLANMFKPGKDGVLDVTGRVEGGHAYLINGINTNAELFRVKNSWGRGWGRKGFAWITFTDMAWLLASQGEACLATEVDQ